MQQCSYRKQIAAHHHSSPGHFCGPDPSIPSDAGKYEDTNPAQSRELHGTRVCSIADFAAYGYSRLQAEQRGAHAFTVLVTRINNHSY
jgi:hypothetical protein